MGKKVLKYAISLLLAAALLYFAFRGVDWASFADGLRQTQWAYIALLFLASLLAVVLREERWRAMLLPIDGSVRRLDVWDSANVGNLVNVVLPGAGEFVRCAYVSRGGLGYDKALGTVVFERMWDMLAVALLFVAALACGWGRFGEFFVAQIWRPFADRMDFSWWWIAALLIAVVACVLTAVFRMGSDGGFFGRVAGWIKGVGSGFSSFARMRRKWLFLLYTAGIWTMYVVMSWAGFKAVPALSSLGMADALFISAVGNIASVVPVPGGIGAYHYLVALSLQALFAADWNTGILYATLCHESHAVMVMFIGIISYLSLGLRRRGGRNK